MSQQQERLRIENQRRLEEDKSIRQANQQNTVKSDDTFSTYSTMMGSVAQTRNNEEGYMASSPLPESHEMKMRRIEIASKLLPLASNSTLRDLLQDLCDNADMQTINIMMKHV